MANNRYRDYSVRDIDYIKKAVKQGKSVIEIANNLNRSEGAIYQKKESLGLGNERYKAIIIEKGIGTNTEWKDEQIKKQRGKHKCNSCCWGTWTEISYKCLLPRCLKGLGNFAEERKKNNEVN